MSVNKTVDRLGLAALLATAMWISGCDHAEQPPAPEDQPPPEVGVVKLAPQRVELFTALPGRTSPYRVAEVRPQVDGIVQKRLFEEGSQVRAGEVLYQIDPKPYRAVYNQAKADLAKARAAIPATRLRAQRLKSLLEDRAVSEQDYDDARATVEQNQAQVQVAQAALEQARLNLDYTSVTAPIDGTIGSSLITEGGLVTANQAAPLAQITQFDPFYVDMVRSTGEVLRLKREFNSGTLDKAGPDSAKVSMIFDDGTEYAHSGTLKFSGVTVDPGTSTITLRAVFPNPDGTVLPGMFVKARVSEGVKTSALMVPQQGISHDQEGRATALVVNDANEVEERQVETREAIGSFWMVTRGLDPGDVVIVSGLHHAHAGATVKPVPEDIADRPPAGAPVSNTDDTDTVEPANPGQKIQPDAPSGPANNG